MPKTSFYCFTVLLLLCCAATQPAAAQEPAHPFRPGEKLTYAIRWGFLPAGTAEFLVRPMTTMQGISAHHFSLAAKTSRLVEVFYKFQMVVNAYMDADGKRSLHYAETHSNRKNTKSSEIRFDWGQNTAQYVVNNKEKPSVTIPPGALDWFSAFYYLRTLDVDKPDAEKMGEFSAPVTDGRQCVIGRAVVAENDEAVELDDTTYHTRRLKLSADGHVGTLFKKEKKMEVLAWVTNDDRRIPVRLKSKLVFGSVVAELVSVDTVPVDLNTEPLVDSPAVQNNAAEKDHTAAVMVGQ